MPSTKFTLLLTPGTRGSASAKRLAMALSEKLGYKVIRSIKPPARRTPVRYGQGVDKLTQFGWFQENNIQALEFTTCANVASQWVSEGYTVFGRRLLNSSCGRGIVVFDGSNSVTPDCPVYTKYKKKKREFRVHIYKEEVVRIVEKKLRSGWTGPRDSKIRNLTNGYVFCSCDSEPSGIRELALRASRVVQSDFKGVDIGYNEKQEELFVIEVNSAPGIEGSNINAYIEAILK